MNTLKESGRVKIPDQVRFQVNPIHNGNFMMTQTQDNLVVMKKNVVPVKVNDFSFSFSSDTIITLLHYENGNDIETN